MTGETEYWGWADSSPKITPEQRIRGALYVFGIKYQGRLPARVVVAVGQEPTTDVGVPVVVASWVQQGAAYCASEVVE